MESKRGHDKLINGYGISEGKSNLATGSFGFRNEMDINDLEREFKFSTKGIQKKKLRNKYILRDRANHEFYKSHL